MKYKCFVLTKKDLFSKKFLAEDGHYYSSPLKARWFSSKEEAKSVKYDENWRLPRSVETMRINVYNHSLKNWLLLVIAIISVVLFYIGAAEQRAIFGLVGYLLLFIAGIIVYSTLNVLAKEDEQEEQEKKENKQRAVNTLYTLKDGHYYQYREFGRDETICFKLNLCECAVNYSDMYMNMNYVCLDTSKQSIFSDSSYVFLDFPSCFSEISAEEYNSKVKEAINKVSQRVIPGELL